MKTIRNLITLSAFLLVNIFALNAATEVATIAGLKSLASESSVVFTGELTLQYVSIKEGGSDYYAFDANSDFVRIRCYNWASLLETTPLKKGDKIKIAEEVTYLHDAENCVTLDLSATAVKSITVVGSASVVLPEVVTIEALKQDVDKNYSAKFVKLQGVSIESVVDFLISPFPINRIVCNGESIDYSMDLVETTFPSIADVSGFVYYKNGNPALFIPQSEGYVKASAYNTIAGLKMMEGDVVYDDIAFIGNVLITDVRELGDKIVYVAQGHNVSRQPVAVEILVDKTHNVVCEAGDSVKFDVVGAYKPSLYKSEALDKLNSARFTVTTVNDITVLSKGNDVDFISFGNVLTENGWIKYDNCLVITTKGEFVVDERFTSIGCVGLRIRDDISSKYDTIPVVDTYYKAAGSPATIVLRGFVCGLELNGVSYAVLLPRSEEDFLKDLVEFENIASMKEAGKSPSIDISYKLTGDMTITGFASEKFDVGTFYHVFVQDASGALQLNHQSATIQKKYKVGDVITNVVGYYTTGGKTYEKHNSVYYASAPSLDIKTIEMSYVEPDVVPVEVSLADLNDSYASQLITIKNVKYNSAYEVSLNGEIVEKPAIYQGENCLPVSSNYKYVSDLSSVTGVYYLSGVLTTLIPRSQMDIIDEEGGVVASVGNVVADNNLFVADKVVYAEGAQIEIYDIVGREVATGINLVDLSVFDETIVIVKTIYDNDIQFVTKVVVR
jgi:hypothetical protein